MIQNENSRPTVVEEIVNVVLVCSTIRSTRSHINEILVELKEKQLKTSLKVCKCRL